MHNKLRNELSLNESINFTQQKIEFKNHSCHHPASHKIQIDIINPLIDEQENHTFCKLCKFLIN